MCITGLVSALRQCSNGLRWIMPLPLACALSRTKTQKLYLNIHIHIVGLVMYNIIHDIVPYLVELLDILTIYCNSAGTQTTTLR